jgi:hypothetical protein
MYFKVRKVKKQLRSSKQAAVNSKQKADKGKQAALILFSSLVMPA